MHLFVTGANSFVGTHLRKACEERAITCSGVDVTGPFTETILECDIRDPGLADLIPRGAVVVHLAAISRDSDCDANPEAAMSINIGGTANVALAALDSAATHVVFASSEWVYGRSPASDPLTEDMGPAWTDLNSLYAFSKAAGEEILRTQLVSRIPLSVLRFAIIYGPRAANWSAFEYVVNAAREGSVSVGSAATSRRFIHVDDICAGILAAAETEGRELSVWNLAGPESLTLGRIAELTANIVGIPVEVTESNPLEPSVRDPSPDRMFADIAWRAATDAATGVSDVLDFLDGRRM